MEKQVTEQDRPEFPHYFMELAFAASRRSTCPARSVGCVLVQNGTVIGTGYNGAPSNSPHCTEVGCGGDPCIRATHAEVNVIAACAKNGIATRGAVLYTTCRPCARCTGAIIAAGISRVVHAGEFTGAHLQMLTDAEVVVERHYLPHEEAGTAGHRVGAIKIHYTEGDVCKYLDERLRIRTGNESHSTLLIHVVNCSRKWGKGFVLALDKYFPAPRHCYLSAFPGIALGDCQFVPISERAPYASVVNMFAMQDIASASNPTPLDYAALRKCLVKVRKDCLARPRPTEIVMPKIGAGLARGDWGVISTMIQEELCDHGIYVTVFTLKDK